MHITPLLLGRQPVLPCLCKASTPRRRSPYRSGRAYRPTSAACAAALAGPRARPFGQQQCPNQRAVDLDRYLLHRFAQQTPICPRSPQNPDHAPGSNAVPCHRYLTPPRAGFLPAWEGVPSAKASMLRQSVAHSGHREPTCRCSTSRLQTRRISRSILGVRFRSLQHGTDGDGRWGAEDILGMTAR